MQIFYMLLSYKMLQNVTNNLEHTLQENSIDDYSTSFLVQLSKKWETYQ